MLKIDLHTHILPKEWPDLRERYGCDGWVSLDHHKPCCARMMLDGRCFREIGDNCWDPLRRIEECDRHGVDGPGAVDGAGHVQLPGEARACARPVTDAQRPHRGGLSSDIRGDSSGSARSRCRRTALADRASWNDALASSVWPGCRSARTSTSRNLDARPELLPVLRTRRRRSVPRYSSIRGRCWASERMTRTTGCRGWSACRRRPALAICSMIFGGVLERLPVVARSAFAHGGGSFVLQRWAGSSTGSSCDPICAPVKNDVSTHATISVGSISTRWSTTPSHAAPS